MPHAAFPDLRLRRTRRTGWSRAMVREHHLTPSNLIWPLFVCDGSGGEEPIISLPGVSRWSVDLAVRRAKDAVARSEEHTSELQSLMRISYAVFCLKKKKKQRI